jgi:putative ABC transport system permease protein
MLAKLALRNVLRQKVRTAMTLTAIVFGVAGLIISGGFVQDIYIQLGEAIIHSQTGHIQVFKPGYLDEGTRRPERFLIDAPAKTVDTIAAIPGVAEVTARLSFSGLLNNGRRDLAIIGEGVEPDKEARLGTYISVIKGRALKDTDTFGMMVGQGVAQALGLKPGDRTTLVMNTTGGALNTLDMEVVGIFQSFSRDFDARAVRIPLAAAQQLMQTQGANLLVVTLDDTAQTLPLFQAVNERIGSHLEARHWRQLSDFYDKTVQLYDRQFGILQVIILAMVLLSVVNSVNMSVFERQSEFGTMQALGNRTPQVFRLLLVENAYLGLAGAALGVTMGLLIAVVVSAIGIPMPPPPNANLGYVALIRIVPGSVVSAFFIGLVATALAAILPARRVARTPIVDALRQGV